MSKRNVVLIVIDALASRVVRPALEEGRLPHLRELVQAGRVNWECTAIFPSITPAATCALVTGGYPAESGVGGAYFYDQDDGQVHYFGDDIQAVMNRGFGTYFEDFLVKLNRDRLRIPTVYERVERAGGRAASLNYLWFRSDGQHDVHTPWTLWLLPGVPLSATIPGPAILSLGDFVSARVGKKHRRLKGPGGMFRRYGFSDATTAKQLLIMAEEDSHPEFTVAYFPDNDYSSHDDGPAAALATVERVDEALGKYIRACGGLDALLKSTAVIVTGDHSQSDLLPDNAECGILLEKILEGFSIAPAGRAWEGDEQLMVCPNMRAAEIYVRRREGDSRPDDLRSEIVDRLLRDERVDQVMWRQGADDGRDDYFIQTARFGTLRFRAGAAAGSASDEYGTDWEWEGDLRNVDGQVDAAGRLRFGKYPNAFERIVGSFDESVSGDLWVTAQLQYEFRVMQTSVHRHGSHGSLHRDDSFSPLILAGVDADLIPQQTPRSVDVAALGLSVLGIEAGIAAGKGHVGVVSR